MGVPPMDRAPLPPHLDAMTIQGTTDQEIAQIALLNRRVLEILDRDLNGLLAFSPALQEGDQEIPLTLTVPAETLSDREIELVAPLLAREIGAKILDMAVVVIQTEGRSPIQVKMDTMMELIGPRIKWLLGNERTRLKFADETQTQMKTTWTKTSVGWHLHKRQPGAADIDLNWISVSEMPGSDLIGVPNPSYIHRPVMQMSPTFLVGSPLEYGSSVVAACNGTIWCQSGGIHGIAMSGRDLAQSMSYGRK